MEETKKKFFCSREGEGCCLLQQSILHQTPKKVGGGGGRKSHQLFLGWGEEGVFEAMKVEKLCKLPLFALLLLSSTSPTFPIFRTLFFLGGGTAFVFGVCSPYPPPPPPLLPQFLLSDKRRLIASCHPRATVKINFTKWVVT